MIGSGVRGAPPQHPHLCQCPVAKTVDPSPGALKQQKCRRSQPWRPGVQGQGGASSSFRWPRRSLAASLQPLPGPWPRPLCRSELFGLPLTRTLVSERRVPPDSRGGPHVEILNFITSAKTLFPEEITCSGPGGFGRGRVFSRPPGQWPRPPRGQSAVAWTPPGVGSSLRHALAQFTSRQVSLF